VANQDWGADMIEVVGALLLTAAGILLAWRAWSRRSRGLLGASIFLSLVATILWCSAFGAEIGIPLAIGTGSLAALGFVVSRTERRPNRSPRERIIPSPPPTRWRWLNGAARTIVAGPLGLVTAMGVAVAIAIRAPMVEQTRLIVAGLIVPSLWAAFLIWAIATRRLGRTAAGLVAIGFAGFAVAMIPRG
jgi:hypothetical protein